MRKKINLALITIGIVIAGVALVTGIARFNNRNKTEVKDNQTSTSISEQVETPESSATDESLIDSTVKSELENKENISENNDLHANAGGSGEISLEQTEDGSFKDPAIDHQDENNASENNITTEPVIKGYDNTNNAETTPKTDFSMVETGDASWDLDGVEQGADLPTDEDMQWAMDLIEQNGTVLH